MKQRERGQDGEIGRVKNVGRDVSASEDQVAKSGLENDHPTGVWDLLKPMRLK